MEQDYLFLNPKFDGMTAWEIAGKILRVLEDDKAEEEFADDVKTPEELQEKSDEAREALI